jgi:membrane-anchored mycosin MYCP
MDGVGNDVEQENGEPRVGGAIESGRVQESFKNQFVVATEHLNLVLDRLGSQRAEPTDSDDYLGLTLVPLRDFDGAIDEAIAHLQRTRVAENVPPPDRPPPEGTVEALLAELRQYFSHRYDGWTPTMGKNRVMRGVHFYPYPDAAGGTAPEPERKRSLASLGLPDAGRDVRIGLLDTELYEHEGLRGRFYAARNDLLAPTNNNRFWNLQEYRPWWKGHATFIAGLILQRAPAAELHVQSVLDPVTGTASLWNVAKQLVRSTHLGLDVINVSFGCYTDDGRPPLALLRAIERITPSVVVVAAAGNYGLQARASRRTNGGADPLPTPTTPIFPAALEQVIAVGAVDARTGEPAPFNPPVPWLDLLAPGVDVESYYLQEKVELPPDATNEVRTAAFDGMARWSGTSFAAAAVSGAVAAALRIPQRRTADEALGRLGRGSNDGSSKDISLAPPPKN